MVKWYVIEKQVYLNDCCLQLYGGYGYMCEYLVVWVYFDLWVQMIYGGMIEIMKEIIGCGLGVQVQLVFSQCGFICVCCVWYGFCIVVLLGCCFVWVVCGILLGEC